jgi:hypothetical protein
MIRALSQFAAGFSYVGIALAQATPQAPATPPAPDATASPMMVVVFLGVFAVLIVGFFVMVWLRSRGAAANQGKDHSAPADPAA